MDIKGTVPPVTEDDISMDFNPQWRMLFRVFFVLWVGYILATLENFIGVLTFGLVSPSLLKWQGKWFVYNKLFLGTSLVGMMRGAAPNVMKEYTDEELLGMVNEKTDNDV